MIKKVKYTDKVATIVRRRTKGDVFRSWPDDEGRSYWQMLTDVETEVRKAYDADPAAADKKYEIYLY